MLNFAQSRILALGAHPDDIELGCLGLLIKAAENGASVRCLTLAACSSIRLQESTAALRYSFGRDSDIRYCHFTDGELVCNSATVAAVEMALGDANIILTMTKWDTHQDHRAVEEIALSACRRRPVTILGYQGMSSTNNFQADIFVALEPSTLTSKLAAIKMHKSQRHRPYMQPSFLNNWHHDRSAMQMGLGIVEVFHTYQLVA